ncbi:MAG: hypothetical protein JWO78_2098 [Micavibrio sp.]|nr:hypothetical protein [Micavibrio sp.]
MHTITYVSSAKELFSDEALLHLLEKSRENNKKFNITGMLLYKMGNFIQSIEGPEEAVQQLYRNIRADKTHHTVLTLIDEPTDRRDFPDWSMGFHNISKDYSKIPAYKNFMNDYVPPVKLHEIQSEAKVLLESFRGKLR